MKEIVTYFIHLGVTGFGGPLALIAQMQRELVETRKWMSLDDFRQTLGLIKSMPGSIGTQTAIFLGHHRQGFWGGMTAGICLNLPSFFLMILLAEFYNKFVEIQWIQSVLSGMQVGACALILLAANSLSAPYRKSSFFWFLSFVSFSFLHWLNISESIVILGMGIFFVFAKKIKPSFFLFIVFPFPFIKNFLNDLIFNFEQNKFILSNLFLVCLKAGAFVFGSGLAIVPFLENDFVNRLNWMSHAQFMDALAFGQLTPGPVLLSVSFVGFKVAGWTGAVLATIGVYFSSFFHMLTWFPKATHWMKQQKWIADFTFGVISAVVASIFHAELVILNQYNVLKIILVFIAFVSSLFFKIPSWAMILFGAVIGVLIL